MRVRRAPRHRAADSPPPINARPALQSLFLSHRTVTHSVPSARPSSTRTRCVRGSRHPWPSSRRLPPAQLPEAISLAKDVEELAFEHAYALYRSGMVRLRAGGGISSAPHLHCSPARARTHHRGRHARPAVRGGLASEGPAGAVPHSSSRGRWEPPLMLAGTPPPLPRSSQLYKQHDFAASAETYEQLLNSEEPMVPELRANVVASMTAAGRAAEALERLRELGVRPASPEHLRFNQALVRSRSARRRTRWSPSSSPSTPPLRCSPRARARTLSPCSSRPRVCRTCSSLPRARPPNTCPSRPWQERAERRGSGCRRNCGRTGRRPRAAGILGGGAWGRSRR